VFSDPDVHRHGETPDAAPQVAVAQQFHGLDIARMQTAGYVQAVELLCNSDLGRSVGRLSMPVHVWVGEHDVVTPPAACRDWARKLGAQYATIADAGHAVAVEQAQTVAQRLAGLLGGVPVPQG